MEIIITVVCITIVLIVEEVIMTLLIASIVQELIVLIMNRYIQIKVAVQNIVENIIQLIEMGKDIINFN